MSKNVIYLSGKASWAHRLFEFDEFRGKRFWSVTLYPDPKSFALFKEVGLAQKVKEDDEGKYVVFRRYVDKKWKLKPGESPEFSPPRVTNSEGEPWNEEDFIGNGSKLTLKLEIYNTINGAAARLEGARVDEWIEYKRPEEDSGNSSDASIRPF